MYLIYDDWVWVFRDKSMFDGDGEINFYNFSVGGLGWLLGRIG